MKEFVCYAATIFLCLFGQTADGQNQFFINGKSFYLSPRITDVDGNIYFTIYGYYETLSVNGNLLDGTPAVRNWGIEYSPDLAVVKLNADLEVQWIDVVSGNNSKLVSHFGRLQLDDNQNLYLEVFAKSDIFFSNGVNSKIAFGLETHQTIFVNYNRHSGEIIKIEAFKFGESGTSIQNIDVLENGDWLVRGMCNALSFSLFDTVVDVPFYKNPMFSGYVTRYSPTANKLKWISFIAGKSPPFVGSNYLYNSFVADKQIVGIISTYDSLFINGNLIDYTTGPSMYNNLAHLYKMNLETGKTTQTKLLTCVAYGPYGRFLKTDYGFVIATIPFYDFEFDRVKFEGNLPDNRVNSYLLNLDTAFKLLDHIKYEPLHNSLETPNLFMLNGKVVHVSAIKSNSEIAVGNKKVSLAGNTTTTALAAYFDENLNCEYLIWPFKQGTLDYYNAYINKGVMYDEMRFGNAKTAPFKNVDYAYGSDLWVFRKNPTLQYVTPADKRFEVYPNVFDGDQNEIYIVFDEETDCEVALVDATGKIVVQEHYNSTALTVTIKIPQHKISSGNYFLKIKPTNSAEQSFKLIKL